MKSTIKDIMSSHPMTVRSKDDLPSAYNRMKREGFRHMPVIDDDGNLVGIISDRDFKRALWDTNNADAHGLPEGPTFRKGAKVIEYMSWPVKTLSEETSLQRAVNLMIDEKISAVVILRENQLVGIVTHEDLLRVLAEILKGRPSFEKSAFALNYDSPISRISEMLSTAGI